jgi:putative tryptophan/tyrosine transport system substrate-binding protein
MGRRRIPARIVARAALATALLAAAVGALAAPAALAKKDYKVYIVVDNMIPKFQELAEGFEAVLDGALAAAGAKAAYTLADTRTESATGAAILESIKAARPDLVLAINGPACFADLNVTLKLDPAIKVVSLNAIPVQSGAAKSWSRPGGSITGVGVYLQFNSMLRLAKLIDPSYKRLAFFSWSAVKQLNDYLEPELRAAAKAEGFELVEFKKPASAEEQFEWERGIDKLGKDIVLSCAVSAWAHADGSFADMSVDEPRFTRAELKNVFFVATEETTVETTAVAGTCIIWDDIGAQLGEKALRVLGGENPGDMAWDYPRKFNVMLNLAAARKLGLAIPKSIIDAAYRVFTDFDGDYVGKR